MQELLDILSNTEKDNTYKVLRIFKENQNGRTELVMSGDGRVLIRKYFSRESVKHESEYQILSGLSHPFLPKVFDHYELSGQSVLIEEYIEGVKLSDAIQAAGSLTIFKTLDLTLKLCFVVNYLHSRKPAPIIHRDIKPDNILVKEDGTIRLIDFGAARNYKTGKEKDTVYVGTLGYAPPEQFGFGQTDSRADIYAIGMTMVHMLTGIVPERGNKKIPLGPNIPAELQTIINKATEFDPENRYRDVPQLIAAIKGLPILKHDSEKLSHATPYIISHPRIYPVYCKWPFAVKVILLPVHFLFLLTFVCVFGRDLFIRTGYGKADDLLQFFCDFGDFVFLLFPGYILGFNLFNLNDRFRFFKRYRLLKKIFIVLSLMVAGAFLITYLNNLHSEAYRIANALNSAVS